MKNTYLNGEFFSILETQALLLKSDLTGYFGGKHLTKSYGQTVEFADYREYMLGDDIRRIDWNLYSRFEKYFLKLFTDERQMKVEIYVDCSASMGKVIPQKGQYVVALAAGLGYLAVHNMDRVAFKFIREDRIEDSTGVIVGKSAFFLALQTLDRQEFSDDSFISQAVLNEGNSAKRNGLTVLISDFLTENEWKKAVDLFCYNKRQVLIVQVLAQEEISPAYMGRMNLIDSESLDLFDGKNLKMRVTGAMHQAYDKACRAIREDIRKFCVSRGVGFVSLSTQIPVQKAIFQELLKVGLLV